MNTDFQAQTSIRSFDIFCQSRRMLNRLMNFPKEEVEEVIFIDFRPSYLKPQQLVYKALLAYECTICMYTYFSEMISRQHNPHHPNVCQRCMLKLQVCPFCRTPIQHKLDISAEHNEIARVLTYAYEQVSRPQTIARMISAFSPPSINDDDRLRALAQSVQLSGIRGARRTLRFRNEIENENVRRRLIEVMQEDDESNMDGAENVNSLQQTWPSLSFFR